MVKNYFIDIGLKKVTINIFLILFELLSFVFILSVWYLITVVGLLGFKSVLNRLL